jgi:hypothetical protein
MAGIDTVMQEEMKRNEGRRIKGGVEAHGEGMESIYREQLSSRLEQLQPYIVGLGSGQERDLSRVRVTDDFIVSCTSPLRQQRDPSVQTTSISIRTLRASHLELMLKIPL